MDSEQAVTICKALGDANRLKLVQTLTHGERCACELLETMKITQPTLSHHMKILAEASLVHARKDGKWTHYSLNCEVLTAYREFIGSLRCDFSQENDEGRCCP